MSETLASLGQGERFGIVAISEQLRRLLKADLVTAYSLEAEDLSLSLDRWHITADAPFQRSSRQVFDRFIRAARPTWSAYNPIRPQPEQRNQVFTLSQLERVTGADPRQLPVHIEVFSRLGVAAMDQCRALICEGSSLLAWVGAYRERPFGRRERSVLRALLPALHRRLRVEREFAKGHDSAALFEAALDAIGTATFILGPRGQVVHANAAGVALWSDGPKQTIDELREVVRHPARPSAFQLTPLRFPGLDGHHLAIHRPPRTGLAPRLRAAAQAWELTPRQAAVLEQLASGETNKAIAARLGCAEVTVELHVSAILQKSGAENRSAVTARVWAFEPG